MNRNLVNLMFVIGLLFVITACVCRSDRDNASPSKEDDKPVSNMGRPAESPAPSTSATKIKDEGDFTVDHIAVTNPKYAEIDRQVRNEKLLEKAADQLNKSLVLPHDIELRTKVLR